MKVDTYVDKCLTSALKKENDEKEAAYKGSGRLSASQLGWPLQWQILKSMGVQPPPPDAYTLRKFARGNHVEDWFIRYLPNLIDKQQKVEYRGAAGKYDALVDTLGWDFNVGVIPIEVKSVTNAKFRYIKQRKSSDRAHLLQGGFYALALNKPSFGIAYVASDDYRVRIHIHSVRDIERDINAIISKFDAQMSLGVVPIFEPEEDWQKNIKYNMYPEWSELSEDEIKSKLKKYGL